MNKNNNQESSHQEKQPPPPPPISQSSSSPLTTSPISRSFSSSSNISKNPQESSQQRERPSSCASSNEIKPSSPPSLRRDESSASSTSNSQISLQQHPLWTSKEAATSKPHVSNKNHSSSNLDHQTKIPKRLRKQINIESFKQNYFELIPENDDTSSSRSLASSKSQEGIPTIMMDGVFSSSSSGWNSSQDNSLSSSSIQQVVPNKRMNSEEPLNNSKKKYKMISFVHADEELKAKEREKQAIRAQSSHFLLPNSKHKRKKKKEQDMHGVEVEDQAPPSQTEQHPSSSSNSEPSSSAPTSSMYSNTSLDQQQQQQQQLIHAHNVSASFHPGQPCNMHVQAELATLHNHLRVKAPNKSPPSHLHSDPPHARANPYELVLKDLPHANKEQHSKQEETESGQEGCFHEKATKLTPNNPAHLHVPTSSEYFPPLLHPSASSLVNHQRDAATNETQPSLSREQLLYLLFTLLTTSNSIGNNNNNPSQPPPQQ
ncbi:hypothetical protein FDP41_010410 [Naegleria fowleri]|uniref:Uncharacterized protein n=1 Tax=Naegleria fowleri TaxID=5763 RepID=A0A6A5CDB9_NAEFO|nr:uncharacterized protein FDP41_010410 [Naegleria fowleri]KAF0983345.1 hypothetical protein FDP41_010410 [Naegleria fowleri]CAG4713142.1 unnamed protein product [Naegleria fowleri]